MTPSVERIAAETQRVISSVWMDRELCILSTAVFTRACEYFEIPATPVKVKAAVFNPVATEWVLEGRDIDANEGRDCLDAGGYVVQIDTTHENLGRYPGHLCALVDDALVDANFGQFSRPERNMKLPATAVFALCGYPFPEQRLTAQVDGSTVIYQAWPDAPDYSTTPDWSDRKSKPLAGQVIRNLRAEPCPE